MCPPPCGPRRSPRRSRSKSEPSYKYAAKFKIGFLETTAASSTLAGLVDSLWENQDLSCLSRQARAMGNAEDAKEAERLDRFIRKFHSKRLRSEDVRNMCFTFSIGSLECLKFTSSEDEIATLMEK